MICHFFFRSGQPLCDKSCENLFLKRIIRVSRKNRFWGVIYLPSWFVPNEVNWLDLISKQKGLRQFSNLALVETKRINSVDLLNRLYFSVKQHTMHKSCRCDRCPTFTSCRSSKSRHIIFILWRIDIWRSIIWPFLKSYNWIPQLSLLS